MKAIMKSEPAGLRFYSPAEVAARLGIGKRTFFRLLSEGRFPPADLRLSPKLPRWEAATLAAWAEANSASK
jgi:excisionase family DNA binding protein